MRLITFNFKTFDEAINFANSNLLAGFVHSIVWHGEYSLIIQFKEYNTYAYYAERLGWDKLSVDEYIGSLPQINT